MPGGLMNIASQGNSNVLFTGNPTKTFFKSTNRCPAIHFLDEPAFWLE